MNAVWSAYRTTRSSTAVPEGFTQLAASERPTVRSVWAGTSRRRRWGWRRWRRLRPRWRRRVLLAVALIAFLAVVPRNCAGARARSPLPRAWRRRLFGSDKAAGGRQLIHRHVLNHKALAADVRGTEFAAACRCCRRTIRRFGRAETQPDAGAALLLINAEAVPDIVVTSGRGAAQSDCRQQRLQQRRCQQQHRHHCHLCHSAENEIRA